MKKEESTFLSRQIKRKLQDSIKFDLQRPLNNGDTHYRTDLPASLMAAQDQKNWSLLAREITFHVVRRTVLIFNFVPDNTPVTPAPIHPPSPQSQIFWGTKERSFFYRHGKIPFWTFHPKRLNIQTFKCYDHWPHGGSVCTSISIHLKRIHAIRTNSEAFGDKSGDSKGHTEIIQEIIQIQFSKSRKIHPNRKNEITEIITTKKKKNPGENFLTRNSLHRANMKVNLMI